MRYKNDWEMAKKRLTAFWSGEIIDRCCISITALEKNVSSPIPLADAERFIYWTDPEHIIKRNRLAMENTYYGGEAFPLIFINLGASGHAGFFKGERHYFENSVWFFPSLEDPAELEFDENSFLYRKTLELARAFAEDSRGDYIVSMPDCTGNADALSHLMGPENMMLAMLDDPEAVQGALAKINAAYKKTMAEVYDIVKDVNEGGSSVGWLNTWAPGFHAQMQSDMSVMISNDMFRTFVLPELQDQCRFLEYPLYHFDGIEQIRHLDDMLAIPELRVIQWTQVVGQPPATDYIPELKRIQAAGKNLIISVTPDQIEPLMENLSSRGLYLLTSAPSRDEADAIIKKVSKLTRD
ncbi:MAG: trimethylamine corrinoid protein 2 [Clostridia bacterium]|nr:trimethylamine corrinoid protein 2 [Clostridia bacterium]